MPLPAPPRPLPIATRQSPLAMAQARLVQAGLAAAHGLDAGEADGAFPILGLTTTGDRIQDRLLIEAGGKGLFTKEIDEALLSGRATFAVHSMKDVPAEMPNGLVLAAALEREDPRDMLLTATGSARLADLPPGARLGTASVRRQAQALALRPDLAIVAIRGNVDTRLAKLRAGEADATFLARAGLKRLGRPEAAFDPVEPEDMLPAGGQGVIGVAARGEDSAALAAARALNHGDTEISLAAERGFLAALDGSCRTPIAAYAVIADGVLHLRGEALLPDGSQVWRREAREPVSAPGDAARFGRALGEAVRKDGGEALRGAIGAI